MSTILYFDCPSGISGDMTVGALVDLGVKPSTLEWELSKIDIGEFHMHFDRAQRKGVEGIHFTIHEGSTHTEEHEGACCDHDHGHDDHDHGHEHAHAHSHDEEHEHEHSHGHEHEHEHGHSHAHEHAHEHQHSRSHAQIRSLISQSELTDFVKTHALGIFRRIAQAEGKIHGQSPDDVTFHEVGALDSIADIVCACVGIEELRVDKIIVSPLHEGHGWVDCAHGRFPVPTPATLEILKGISLQQIDEPHELITPTGAAIAAEFASEFALMPALTAEKIGYGLGTRDLASRPNVLRAVLGVLS
ncbi:MAG: LarC family nickel insertion protein [Chthoniobacteraceae bacterium]